MCILTYKYSTSAQLYFILQLSKIPKPAVIQCKSGIRAQSAIAAFQIANVKDSNMMPLLVSAYALKKKGGKTAGGGCG